MNGGSKSFYIDESLNRVLDQIHHDDVKKVQLIAGFPTQWILFLTFGPIMIGGWIALRRMALHDIMPCVTWQVMHWLLMATIYRNTGKALIEHL